MVISSDACLIFGAIAGIVAVYLTPGVTCDDAVDEGKKKPINPKPKIVVHNPDGNTISDGMKDKIYGERTFESLKTKVISFCKTDIWKMIIPNGNSHESSSGASFHSANEHFTNQHRIGRSSTEIDIETLGDSDNTTYLPLDLSIHYSNKRRNEQGTFNNIVDDNNNTKEKGLLKISENDNELIGSLRQSTFIDTQNKVSHIVEMRNTLRQLGNLGEHAAADECTQETAHNNNIVIVFKRSMKPLRRIFRKCRLKHDQRGKRCKNNELPDA